MCEFRNVLYEVFKQVRITLNSKYMYDAYIDT